MLCSGHIIIHTQTKLSGSDIQIAVNQKKLSGFNIIQKKLSGFHMNTKQII